MWIAVSVVAAAAIVAAMERWTRSCALRHSAVVAAVLMCSTFLFAKSVATERWALAATLFSVLALRDFFLTYRCNGQRRWLVPVWLFGAMLCGGVAGIVAPLAAITAWITVKRRWKDVGQWIGIREVLIFSILCLLWFATVYRDGPIFTPPPREHLFWYMPRILWNFLPWTPLYVVMICLGVWRKRLKTDIAKFLYTTVWADILVLSLLSGKADACLLPICPMIAYLTAALIVKKRKTRSGK